MTHPQKHFLRALATVAIAACALSAHAFSLFGGDGKSDALSAIRKADKILSRADSVYDGGNPDQALELYRKALAIYSRVEEKFPGLEDGIAGYRMTYCNDQIGHISGPGDAAGQPAAPAVKQPSLSFDDAITGAAFTGTGAASATPDGASADAIGEDSAAVEAMQLSAEAVSALLAEARFALEEGRVDDAATAALDILRADPQNRSARLMMGVARTRQQRFDEARVALEDLQAEGEDEAVLLALSAVYQAIGRNDRALSVLNKAIQLDSKRPDPYMNMAWLMLGAGDADSADAYYRVAVRLGAARDRQLERRLGY